MANLQFYRDEKIEFQESYSKILTHKEAEIIAKKLNRHYKLNGWLHFTNRVGGGNCSRHGRIKLRWQTNFGILCHEFAHLYEFKKYGESHHRKRLNKIMSRMINYCKKKNYWVDEIDKRTTIKVKPQPTKNELQTQKLEKKKSDLLRYKKKLSYYTKLYLSKIKKANRSISMLERYINQQPEVSIAGGNQEAKSEVTNGLPPTSKDVGIRPTIL